MAASLLTRAKMLVKGLFGASLGAIQHMLHRQDHQTLVNHLEAQAKAERAGQPKPKGVTIVAAGPGWKPSSPSMVSGFMAPLDYPHDRARLPSSYRGARRNAAKYQRRAVLGGYALPSYQG